MDVVSSQRLAGIVAQTLGIDPSLVNPEMTADDVESWDSLNHLRLITAIEEHFGVRFSMSEVLGLRTIGDLAALLDAHGRSH